MEYQKPDNDEIEISIFGPGVGESILIHLGNGAWIVVDSCVCPDTNEPIALRYLSCLGVNPSTAIKRIVATHWHDDHVRGLADTFSIAHNSEFVCSGALRQNEFWEALETTRRPFMEDSGLSEFRRIFDALAKKAPRNNVPCPIWAHSNMCIYKDTDTEIYSLSPSAGAYSLSIIGLGNLLPSEGEPKRRTVSIKPNTTAVVLWIRVGETRILLGSDLENSTDASVGWRAILKSNEKPDGKASVFKVPHHGSRNADNEDVWKEMLVESPIALIAPNRHAHLPKPGDIVRLSQRTPSIYCTATSIGKKSSRRSSSVERLLKRVAPDLREAISSMGHIRVRKKLCEPLSNINIGLFGPAFKAA